MSSSNNSISGIKNNCIDIEYDEIFKYCFIPECNNCNGLNEECDECNEFYENNILLNSKKNIEYILNNIHIDKYGFLNVTSIINLINEIFLEHRECFIYDEDTCIDGCVWEEIFNEHNNYIFLYKFINDKFNLFFIDKETKKIKKIYRNHGHSSYCFLFKLNCDFENYNNGILSDCNHSDESDCDSDCNDCDSIDSYTSEFFYDLLEFFQSNVLEKFNLFNKYRKNLLQKLRIISCTIENSKKFLVEDTIITIISYLYEDSEKLLNVLNHDCKILNNIELDVLTLTKNETDKLFNDIDELYKSYM